MTYGGQSGPDPGMSTEPPTRRPLGAAAVVIAVLAVVVVLGVVAGVVVIAVGGIGPLGRPDPPPASSATPSGNTGPSGDTGPSGNVPAEPPTPLPPVTAANLPTSGDLVWPGSAWHVATTDSNGAAEPVTPCQQWSPDAPPARTAMLGRSYRLGDTDGAGRAYAYVISYQTAADAATVADAIVAEALSCATRLQGKQGPRMDVNGPLGSGVVTDLQWSDDAGAHIGTYGVAREGNRVSWIWMEAAGEDAPWLGVAEGHPMVDTLHRALRRLRTGG